jgi:hypothetical protein
MSRGPPEESELAAWGFTWEDLGGEESQHIEVWGDTHRAVLLFAEFVTQWRVGMGGRTGLDYTPLYMRLDRLAQDDSDWEQLYADVRLMEMTVLDELASRQQQT